MGTLQVNSRVRGKDKRSSKRLGSSKAKAKKRTRRDAFYGFLNFRFEPLRPYYPETANAGKVERDFHRSLKYLGQLYGFKPAYFPDLQFPFNISASYKDAVEKLQLKEPSLSLLITTRNKKVCLATGQTFDTGMFLYYVPIGPVYRLLQQEERKPLALLLVSILAYFFQVVKVPHYREGYCYLGDIYHTMCEMMENEWEEGHEELLSFQSQFEDAQTNGDLMLKEMKDKTSLDLFKSRMDEFKPATKNEEEILLVASEVFKLYEDFPKKSVYDNLQGNEDDENEYEDDSPIQLDQYCSFVYDVEGSLYESMEEYIISGLEGCSAKKEPASYQFFDKPQKKSKHNHFFESSLFNLLSELSRCLIHLL